MNAELNDGPPVPDEQSPAAAESSPPLLQRLVTEYLRVLANEKAASSHTLRAYHRELHAFAAHVVGQLGSDVAPAAIEHTHIRAYLASLYDRGLSKASTARALASIRSWIRWLGRIGQVEQNVASLVATPRLPKHLPRVPSIEQMNRVVDQIDGDAASRRAALQLPGALERDTRGDDEGRAGAGD